MTHELRTEPREVYPNPTAKKLMLCPTWTQPTITTYRRQPLFLARCIILFRPRKRRHPLFFDARFFPGPPGLPFKFYEGLQFVGGQPPLSQQINRMQGPLFHQIMDPLLAHPQDGRRAGKRQQTAFPAGYGAQIAKDIQNAFLHFPLRQITGCGGGRGIGWRHHVQRIVYSFMKVKGYFARHAAATGSRTTGPKLTRCACRCACSFDKCPYTLPINTPPSWWPTHLAIVMKSIPDMTHMEIKKWRHRWHVKSGIPAFSRALVRALFSVTVGASASPRRGEGKMKSESGWRRFAMSKSSALSLGLKSTTRALRFFVWPSLPTVSCPLTRSTPCQRSRSVSDHLPPL